MIELRTHRHTASLEGGIWSCPDDPKFEKLLNDTILPDGIYYPDPDWSMAIYIQSIFAGEVTDYRKPPDETPYDPTIPDGGSGGGGEKATDEGFEEKDHPRGKGKNAGRFVKKGGEGSAKAKEEPKDKDEPKDKPEPKDKDREETPAEKEAPPSSKAPAQKASVPAAPKAKVTPAAQASASSHEREAPVRQPINEKAARALAAYNCSTAEKQRIADATEATVAQEMDMDRTPDNSAFDCVERGTEGIGHAGTIAVEVKTMIDGKDDKVTMRKECRLRKLEWAQEFKAKPFTVVVDKRQSHENPSLYYAEGVGSFRLGGGSLKPVKDWATLKGIIRA